MQKFFVEEKQINNNIIEIIGDDVNHIVNVLRLKINNNIIICNKDTYTSYTSKIESISKEKILCKIIDEIIETTEAKVDVTIYQGLPKADKMEYIIQKSTELGAKTIVPVAMKRSIVKIDKKDETKKILRWQKITEVASKQSGRDIIPKIENIKNLDEIIEKIKDYDVFLVAYENEKNNTIKYELKKIDATTQNKIGVLIGPEGGIDELEIDKLVQNNAKIITLGNRILRTETASLAILSNILYEYDL